MSNVSSQHSQAKKPLPYHGVRGTSRFTLIEIHEKTPSGLLGVLRFTSRLGLTCVAQALGNAVDGGMHHRQQLRVLRGLFQVL